MFKTVAMVCLLYLAGTSSAQDLLISNARIIDGEGGLIERGSILIEAGRIVSATEDVIDNYEAAVVDAKGMTVMPGMINTHWHLLAVSGAGTDQQIDQYVEDVLAGLLESTLARGVTSIISMGDHYPNILELRGKLASGALRGPRLVAVGPIFTGQNDWPTQLCLGNSDCEGRFTPDAATVEQARRVVKELAVAGVDAIKVVYDAAKIDDVHIDEEIFAAIAAQARTHGLPLIAHVATTQDTFSSLVALGVQRLAHPPYQLTEDETQLLLDMEVPVSTTVSGYTKQWHEISEQEYDLHRSEKLSAQLDIIKRLWDAGVIIAFGTDSYPAMGTFPPNRFTTPVDQGRLAAGRFMAEVSALNQVLSAPQIISSLTGNAAIFLGMEDELGTIAPGKIADLVVIDGDPMNDITDLKNIALVIQNGKIAVDNR